MITERQVEILMEAVARFESMTLTLVMGTALPADAFFALLEEHFPDVGDGDVRSIAEWRTHYLAVAKAAVLLLEEKQP